MFAAQSSFCAQCLRAIVPRARVVGAGEVIGR
jgi:hypothetical protein